MKFTPGVGCAIIGEIGNLLSLMKQRSHRPKPLLGVISRSMRGAWLFTLALVTAIAISQWTGFLFPIPFLLLLTTVVASGAVGGVVSGVLSGLLMAMTILYFWSQGVGPDALTGTLFRAIFGSVVAVAVGYYIGTMREQHSALISELEEQRRALMRMNSELSDQVAAQIAELQIASDRLRDSQARLLRAARRWVQTEEMERRNLARELHDDIGQGLTALHLNLEISKKAVEHDPGMQRLVTTSKELIGEITDSVRQLSMNLRPSLLDDLGLVAAAREHASIQFQKAGIDFKLHREGNDGLIAPDIGIIGFRLMQEAIKNIIQHSKASDARIDICVGDDNVVLRIKDNGKGFDSNQIGDESRHPGLTSMRERSRMMSGQCEIRSKPDEGTDVEIVLPLIVEEVMA
jgi:signal transduction histidine kinase